MNLTNSQMMDLALSNQTVKNCMTASDVTVKAYIDPDLYPTTELQSLIEGELQQLQSTFTMDSVPQSIYYYG